MPKKFLIIGLMVLLFVFLMVSFSITPVKPLTGTKQADLGRKHATSLASPSGDLATSGDHYEDWTKAGVYDSPKDDGNLIHSMEHGYVILSYNCERKFSIFNFQFSIKAYAHEEDEVTEGSQSTSSANLPDDCHTLVDQLKAMYEKKGKRKLIVVQRPNMDSKIALTAWNWIDKLDSFDEKRIESFIDSHRDQGPEKTAE
ncbi:hypothetical protein A3B42_01350 [Candidatus Daviesbacteria bacterium RIFCSPLOWO2_01_FULL_38_10]|nr:MAG: hypothetical protein A3D02_02175 [Candidatus Daviesbacteria bacterium RIFCSPHIGHO2_02_FULL_39_41]OGE38369.1 MAG: hypothetical protein A3B42_01350 [Candidatus Daviesbacteria bacterium RIFCSPLOWO2_01_FULL_38_10]OGE45920.1 MAG: hypothetical protein A3E67_01530 [Candidatus Daviesbacteria bacterium RIFCSPHIGHO2_12_FULL_38_25]OGE68800.1 MAG: hypothetical protein A3H81_04490 [Candidatus Daviesbacteria bacterium RIFCSPLOWO2_02_FULL_38_18]OGE72570.1 MAG: hypothetical protein A3H18_02665 [Candida